MKNVKKLFCAVMTVILVFCTVAVPAVAKDVTTGYIANVIVCVRFADDTSEDRFARDTDTIMKLYDDTTELYSYIPYDYSFREYIKTISRGQLLVENTFPQLDGSVIRPLTLSSSLEHMRDASVLQEVINAFNNGTITLPDGKYDYRTSGILDNLTVILQGTAAQADNSVMWPHKSVCDVNTKIKDRYYVGNYNFINTYSLLDSVTQQGTVSHEFMHTIGFPDLYRGGSMPGVPVGRWDIMASDSMYQQYPLSYMRYKMGWVPMQSISQSGDYTLDPVSDPDSDRILYKLETPLSASEFFVLEFRYKDPSWGTYDSRRFDARIPSSGLLIYRVNNEVLYQSNYSGEDYLYVFRPGETSLTTPTADTTGAAVNPYEGETGYGSADLDAAFTDDTIFYSDGRNSGLVISNVAYSADGRQLSFHVDFPDYSSMDLWENVGASVMTGCSETQGVTDSMGNMYVLSTGRVNYTYATDLYTFRNGSWIKAANSLSGVNNASIYMFNDQLYIIYLNSSYYPVIAKLENGAWRTIVTDTSTQYPNNPQLFGTDTELYCGWVQNGTTLVIKKLNGTGLTAVNSSLTASYFANPCMAADGNYIYALYSDFFGTDKSTKLKRYSLSGGYWQELSIPDPINQSNVHRAEINNGELWFLAAALDRTPIVISVKPDGTVTEKVVPTAINNFLDIGIDVNKNGTLYVGLFTSQNDSEVLYLQNGEWKKLGSKPCEAVQAADMFVYEDTVYVASSTVSNGNLMVRSKEMPAVAVPQLLARENTGIEITDGYVIGIPVSAVDLSLYLYTTEDATVSYTSMGTGAELLLYSVDDVLIKKYTIIVRGDVNADGAIDGQDSVLINAVVAGMTGFTEIQVLACDADGNGTAEADDSMLTFNRGLFIYE